MTEGALPIAIEARELGKSAHKRLDSINGQIADGNRKLDILDGKLDSVLITLARQDGERGANRTFLDSKRFWLVLGVGVLTSSMAALAITLVLRIR